MANENSILQAQTIPLAKIHDLPGVFISKQPDKTYGGLVTSIQASGVKEPVILRLREDGEYQLITGYRRRRASELAKKQDIPALVYNMTVQEAIDYHKRVQNKPDLPIPGKLIEPPTQGDKTQKTDVKGSENPTAGDKSKEVPAAAPGKDGKDQATDPKAQDKPAAPVTGDKPQEPPAAAPGKDGKDQATGPKAQDKPAAPVTGDKPKEAPAATPGKDGKDQATGPKAQDKPAVIGPAAKGPAGTAISQVFDKRLSPPDEKALKDLPAPKDGESFFITLHPAYLEKSKFNVFSVDQSSENFQELKKSVELVGIKDPVLARLKPEGGLEILSGQRRHLAAAALNYPVPTIIQKIDDADAKIIVADGNLHRDKISMYDLSRALRMKMEGMKQKVGRKKKGTFKAEELDSDAKLAKEMGMSVSKLNRMIRLSEATKDVCARVDDGTLHLSIASAISFLRPANQDEVLHLIDIGYKVTTERVERMKKADKAGKLDEMSMRDILDDKDIKPKQAPTPPAPPAHQTNPVMGGPASTLQGGQAVTPIPTSPDVKPVQEQTPGAQPTPTPPDPVIPFPGMSASTTPEPTAQTPAVAPQPTPAETEPAPQAPTANPAPAVGNNQAEKEPFKGSQERPEITKVILTGDRLRKYFPDVSMTPREIEESVYDALEERRQRQLKAQQKDTIFQRGRGPTR